MEVGWIMYMSLAAYNKLRLNLEGKRTQVRREIKAANTQIKSISLYNSELWIKEIENTRIIKKIKSPELLAIGEGNLVVTGGHRQLFHLRN